MSHDPFVAQCDHFSNLYLKLTLSALVLQVGLVKGRQGSRSPSAIPFRS